jgi:hypothetical protein
LRIIKRTSFNRIKLFPLLSGIFHRPRVRKPVLRARTVALRVAAFFGDLGLLGWDQVLRAAPHARKLALRTAAFAKDLALLGWDQILRAAPHARKLALRTAAFASDLVLLGWDQVLRAVPPAKKLALRVPPLARKNLVLPARNVVILMALVILCAGFAQTGPGHSVLSGMGLYQPPVSYTELTFAAPGDLPSALPSPGAPVNVSFNIHNVSGAARVYQWSVVLANNGHNGSQEASGTVTAPAQGRVTVTRSVATTCTAGRLQVLVRLASPAESVEFWVTCPALVQGSR